MSSSVADVREARATGVRVDQESLTIDLVDGRTIIVPLIWFPRLWHGMPQEWTQVEIFGDGLALHWPDLDEDLSVPDLIAGRPSGESPDSLRDWLESRRKAGKPVRTQMS